MKQQALIKDFSQQASEFILTWLPRYANADDRKYAERFLAIGEGFVPGRRQTQPDRPAGLPEVQPGAGIGMSVDI